MLSLGRGCKACFGGVSLDQGLASYIAGRPGALRVADAAPRVVSVQREACATHR